MTFPSRFQQFRDELMLHVEMSNLYGKGEGEGKNESVDSWNAKGVSAEIARGRAHPRERGEGGRNLVSQTRVAMTHRTTDQFFIHRAMRLLMCARLGIAGSLQLTGCCLNKDWD